MSKALATTQQKQVAARRQFLATMLPEDREFLPAALEVLETPPSKAGMRIILTIAAFCFVAVAWCYFGKIDIIATAQGKVQPIGRVKVVQPLETGKVRTLAVANGQHVDQGEVLVQLEDGEALADEKAASEALIAWQGEIDRRRSVMGIVQARRFADDRTISWSDVVPAGIRLREQRIMDSDLDNLHGKVAGLQNQQDQVAKQADGYSKMASAQSDLISTQAKRVKMKETLANKDFGSQANLLDALETMQTAQTTLVETQGNLAKALTELGTYPIEIDRTINDFLATNADALNKAERQRDDAEQLLNKARAKLAHSTIKSPISGRVASLTVTTVGQVITTGTEIMRIIPDDAVLEVEAYLRNRDIGFVNEGQDVIIKVDAFPFTQYGYLTGKVKRIATDAIPEPDAARSEQGALTNESLVGAGGSQRVQNLVYPVSVKLDDNSLVVDGKKIDVISGMTTSVEIKTGKRRILEYLLSPLVEVGSRAITER